MAKRQRDRSGNRSRSGDDRQAASYAGLRRGIAFSCGLAILTFIAFSGSLFNGFIDKYDDESYVTKNANIQDGFSLSSVQYALTGVCVSNWHPVTMFSHILDVQLFGLNAAGHHFTSLLLHAANAILLYWLLRAMTG